MSDTKKHIARKIVRVTALVLGSFLVLAVAAICVMTWTLTPQRLTRMINREVSRMLNADVRVSNARFTLWSTFPHLCIEVDSLRVTSRALDSQPDSILRKLPAGYRELMTTGRLRGGINLLRLLSGQIFLRDLEVETLSLNLVGVTDSISNWNIWNAEGSENRIPFFTAADVSVRGAGNLRFYSRVTGLTAGMSLDGLDLRRSADSLEDYSLRIQGKISARVRTLQILSRFPFRLNGRLRLRFDPFGILTDNYSVALGNTSGKLDMDMQIGKEMKLNNFTYQLDSFSLDRLLDYFPSAVIPRVSGLNADITVNASARLLSSYVFSSSKLPSLDVDFTVPDGEMSYTVNERERYSVRHLGVGARLSFNGENPDFSYFDIPWFRLEGEGGWLDLRGRITDLLGDPEVFMTMKGEADLSKSGRDIVPLRDFGLRGVLRAQADLRFRVSDLQKGKLVSVFADGNVSLANYSASFPAFDISGAGKRFTLAFRGGAGRLDNNDLYDGMLDLKASADRITATRGKYRLSGRKLELESRLSDNGNVRIDALLRSLPFNVDVKAASLEFDKPADTVSLMLRNVDIKGTIKTAPQRLEARKINVNLRGDTMSVRIKGNGVGLRGVSASLGADAMTRPVEAPPFVMPARWKADSSALCSARHSAEFVKVNVPPEVRKIMAGWKTDGRLFVDKGACMVPSLQVPLSFSGLDVSASFESVSLSNVDLRLGETEARVSGRIGNLRQFLSSTVPAPLPINLDLDMDTVQINSLAAAYERHKSLAQGGEKVLPQKSPVVTASDSVALIIPRNIIADVRASARETRYMNLHLYDLSAGMTLRDGDARIENLKISADFGKAYLDFMYRTSDILRLGMEAKLGIMDVDVVSFFDHFHSLLVMMPQMKNLSGTVSAECKGSMLLFPDMYIDIPSLHADINVQGRDLQVHQTPFIRHITRMLLIPDSNDLHFKNINVRGTVHDNLLELYPFDIEFPKYKLDMMGVNNFDGRLYYHIGVKESPVPIPFGINITGMFHDPKLRFGGERFRIDRTREITTSVMENNRMNLMRRLKYFLREFIHAAARSAE